MKKYLFIVLLVGVWSCEENKITNQNEDEDTVVVLVNCEYWYNS